ncbi:MAG: YraN family protein [Actinomycetota bacterium]
MRRDRVWRDGERAAWEAYRRRGYRLVARNWRSPLGELDLVLARGELLVFCEVKARTSAVLGGPFDAVTPAKQRKLRHLAEAFVGAVRPTGSTYRFDVASVTWGAGNAPDVHLFEDAF